jgi:hypothetical protein
MTSLSQTAITQFSHGYPALTNSEKVSLKTKLNALERRNTERRSISDNRLQIHAAQRQIFESLRQNRKVH